MKYSEESYLREEKYESITRLTNIGIWEYDIEADQQWCSSVYFTMLGYNPLDFDERSHDSVWQRLLHPKDAPRAIKIFEDFIVNERKSIYDNQFRLQKKDGTYAWIRSKGKLITENGRKKMVGMHTDITKNKEQEKALEHFNDLMSYIIDHVRGSVAVHDKELKYMYVSENYLKEYQIEAESIIGKHHYEVIPNIPQKWRDVHQRALKGEVVSSEKDSFYREDGKLEWTRWECRPWYDEEGAVGGIVVYTELITDRVEMQEQIIREKELFQATLLSVGDGIISTDREGLVTVMNPVAEELTGWKQEEALGKPFREVFCIYDEKKAKQCEDLVEIVLQKKKKVELIKDAILKAKDGSMIPVEDTAAPIFDHKGSVSGVVIVFRDCSQMREKMQQIKFLSYHDPLTGLHNRRYLDLQIPELNKSHQEPLTVFIADVNGLKLTNDAFGHKMGDRLLRAVARLLKKVIGDKGLIARTGGDEFCMVLPNTGQEEAEEIKRFIVSETKEVYLESLVLSLALGYAVKRDQKESFQNVMVQADNNMYKEKIKYGKIMRSKTIELVLKNINLKYDQEQIHTERVSQYCERLARRLNFREEEVEMIKIAGVLHDIGKITVDPLLLNKREKLSEREFETIKKHVEMSYQILKSADEYISIAEIVLYHHERWDGRGYPEGLKGEEIPLMSRIICVTDAFEAMTAKRPYQRTKSTKEALDELKRNAGKQFDPLIVDAFDGMMRSKV